MNDEGSLIVRILSGDTAAWHTFIEIYSPHIRRTIKRYVKDPEVESDLYASLLEKLITGKLARFESRSSLATWLFAVTRNHCRDHYRGAKGIRHLCMALEGLGAPERRFFILHYVQGLSLQATYCSMRAEMGDAISYLDLFEYRETIRKAIERKKLGRIIDRLLRPDAVTIDLSTSVAETGLDQAASIESMAASPESCLEGRNLQIAIEHLRAAILELPHRDQLVLKLRFEHKRSAREIGKILDLGSEKQIYRKLDRLFGELRSMLLKGDLPADLYREAAEDIENLCRSGGVWESDKRCGTTSVS
jgi:DNA-directed RNA polymerase specialized sigma24 family protein